MDPDEALVQLRRQVNKILALHDRGDDIDEVEALALVAIVIGLDHWLTRGGFPPKDWQH